MYRRIFQAACALVFLQCPLVWSQEVPILPAPSSIPQLAKTVPIDSTQRRTLTVPDSRSTDASSASQVIANGAPRAVQFVNLNPQMLRAPLSRSAGQGQLALGGSGRPKAAVPLALTIEGKALELAAVAETQDPNSIYRYVTAQVLNVPNAYARFTVAGDQIVGTIVMSEVTYRVLPSGGGQVSVHRLAQGTEPNSRFRPIVATENTNVRALERRHLQMERLAQMQPRRASLNESGRYFRAEGGALGKLSGAPSAESIEALVNGIAELTFAPPSLSVQVSKVTKRATGAIVEFQQTINGIPVFGSNQLVTDSQGNVSEITTQLVDPRLAEEATVMAEADARKAAIRQVENEGARRATEYEQIRPSTLVYEREGAGPQKLVAYYTFYLRGLPDGKPVAVHVNAHSGDARVLLNPQAFGWRVCTRFINFPNSSPTTCSDSSAWLLFDNTFGAAQGCVFFSPPKDGPIGCKSTAAKNANYAMKHANVAFDKVAGPLIGGPDRTLDVVYSTNATTSQAEYNVATQSILSRPNDGLLYVPEVVWHEIGHHILNTSNTNVNWAVLYGQPGREFETAFEESFGDLVSVAVAMNINPTTEVSVGQIWTYADGNPSTQRILNDPAITSFYYMTQQNEAHARSKAISKYFNRVFTASGMTATRFFQLVLHVGQNIRDFDASGKVDLVDLRTAMQQAVANEQALLNAVNAEFNTMYNNIPPNQQPAPIGVPTPPLPPAPFPVAAVFTGACPIVDGVRTSEWRVDWGAASGAVTYSVTAIANGVIWDQAQTSGLFVLAHTSLPNGQVYVQGCNSVGQCGMPSFAVGVSHQPSCNF